MRSSVKAIFLDAFSYSVQSKGFINLELNLSPCLPSRVSDPDPDWIRIRIGLQPLKPDPDPEKRNTDPKPCFHPPSAYITRFIPLCCFSTDLHCKVFPFPSGTCCRSASQWCGSRSGFSLDANPDVTFHFDSDPYMTFFHVDADPAPHQSDASLQPLANRPSTFFRKRPQPKLFSFIRIRPGVFRFCRSGSAFSLSGSRAGFRKWSVSSTTLLHEDFLSVFRIRDPVPFWPLDPGWVKKSGSWSGMNNPDHISESLKNYFFVLNYLILWCKSGIRNRKKSDPPIRDPG